MTSAKSPISCLRRRGHGRQYRGAWGRHSVITGPATTLIIAIAITMVLGPDPVVHNASAQTTDIDSLASVLSGRGESLNQDSFRILVQHYVAARREMLLGRPAPAMVTTSLSGIPWRLADQRGKVVVMEFWASWCVACKSTTKAVAELREKYESAQDLVFVGVALDDSLQKVVEFCRKNRIDWLQLFEPTKGMHNSCAKALGVWAIPEVCIIDGQGTVASIFLRSKSRIETEIERLRKQQRD